MGPVAISRYLKSMRRQVREAPRGGVAPWPWSDGFIEGPNGDLDWVDSWEDPFDVVGNVDAFILGAGVYLGYEQY